MEFRGNLYQFGQSGILTFRDGIQEVSGSIPLISTRLNPWKPSAFEFFVLGGNGRNEGETFDHILDHIEASKYGLNTWVFGLLFDHN